MADGLSVGRANAILDNELASVYVQLHTGDPGAAGTANVSAGDSTRKQVTHNSASGGSASMDTFSGEWTNSDGLERITHVSFWTAATSGTFIASKALPADPDNPPLLGREWAETDTLKLSANTWSVSPIAS